MGRVDVKPPVLSRNFGMTLVGFHIQDSCTFPNLSMHLVYQKKRCKTASNPFPNAIRCPKQFQRVGLGRIFIPKGKKGNLASTSYRDCEGRGPRTQRFGRLSWHRQFGSHMSAYKFESFIVQLKFGPLISKMRN